MNNSWLKKGLVVGVIGLFIGTGVASGVQISSNPQPLDRGNWLYVGGSGPGNYTKIQDAIDNASDGDTVFVYDDSSPYFENITVNKRINLTGENKETTIIDGTFSEVFIHIRANEVNVTGFTVQNIISDFGFIVQSNHVTIHNNIIKNTWVAIGIATCSGIITDITITNNIFRYNECGVFAFGINRLHITNNTFTYFTDGIMIGATQNTTIQSNSIQVQKIYSSSQQKNYRNLAFCYVLYCQRLNESTDSTAIWSFDDIKLTIVNNSLQANYTLAILNSSSVTITHNTLLFTNFPFICLDAQLTLTKNNILRKSSINEMLIGIMDTTIRMNGNYWNRPRLLPKILLGYRIINEDKVSLTLFVDWRPALKPYDIPRVAI
jgi:nitrous oxidase accessory protein